MSRATVIQLPNRSSSLGPWNVATDIILLLGNTKSCFPECVSSGSYRAFFNDIVTNCVNRRLLKNAVALTTRCVAFISKCVSYYEMPHNRFSVTNDQAISFGVQRLGVKHFKVFLKNVTQRAGQCSRHILNHP